MAQSSLPLSRVRLLLRGSVLHSPATTQSRWIFGTSFDEPFQWWHNKDNIAAHRVWKTGQDGPSTWTVPIDEQEDVSQLIDRIGKQELEGGRMQRRQLGVLREDPAEDMRLLMENYTVP